jgi:undecaprenyl-diphosphatase
MTAFAITVAFTQFYPSLAFGLMFCALSIAVSRVVLGMHFLSDVVAGAILGAGFGYLATLAFL